MAKVTTLTELYELDPNVVVNCVKGVLKKVHKQRRGKSKSTGKDYCNQDLILEDDQTEIKVVLWERDDLPRNWEGKEVYILATKNSRNQWSGVKTANNTYKNETTRELHVFEGAEIAEVDGEQPPEASERAPAPAKDVVKPPPRKEGAPAPKNAPAPAPAAAATQQRQNAPASNKNPHYDEKLAITKARAHYGRAANGMLLALRAAHYVRDQYNKKFGEQLGPDHFQGMAQTIFLNAERAGIINTLPSKPIEDKPAEAAPQTNREPEPPPPALVKCQGCGNELRQDQLNEHSICAACTTADEDVPF